MQNFSPIHLITIIAIVVIGIGFIFRGAGVSSPAVVQQNATAPVVRTLPAMAVETGDIGKRADDLPPPITRTENETITIDLETKEIVAEMMPGVTYKYWTYNGTVPGPFLRVMEGDDVIIKLTHGVGGHTHADLNIQSFPSLEEAQAFIGTNIAHADGNMNDPHAASSHDAEGHGTHSVDLHSVLGPGGGAMLTQVGHDGPKAFKWKALRPGVYVYHCASPHIPTHIANGMYGLILVEPKGGLPEVDKEFYVMQSDFYTKGAYGELGHQEFDKDKLLAESPSYFTFNGRVGSLTGDRALRAKVGDRIRMYVGVGSHVASNFHLIGGIFDKLYPEGALMSEPLRNVQTTIIPPGGAAVVEFVAEVPGTFLLVDHSLTRSVDKGAIAQLIVEGPDSPELFAPVAP